MGLGNSETLAESRPGFMVPGARQGRLGGSGAVSLDEPSAVHQAALAGSELWMAAKHSELLSPCWRRLTARENFPPDGH